MVPESNVLRGEMPFVGDAHQNELSQGRKVQMKPWEGV